MINKKTIRSTHFLDRSKYETIFSAKEDKYNNVMEGDIVYMNMVNILTDTINYTLYPAQLWALKLAMVPLLPKIYEKNWETNNKEILEKHGLTIIYQIYCLTAPRRNGKTVMLSWLNISALLCIKSNPNDLLIVRQVSKYLDQSYVFFFSSFFFHFSFFIFHFF